MMIFPRKKDREDNNLMLYGKNFEKVESLLEMWFDSGLKWRTHIRIVEEKYAKVLNIMRCLEGVEWGADFESFKYIYWLIRSRLDYSNVAFGSAAKSVIVRLDNIQAQALRLHLGAMRTSPVCLLQVEAGEISLSLCQKQLLVNY